MRNKRLQSQVTAGRWTLPAVIFICALCWVLTYFLFPDSNMQGLISTFHKLKYQSHSADYNSPNYHKAGKTKAHPLPLFYLPCL